MKSKDAIEALSHLDLETILFNYWDGAKAYRLGTDLVVSALTAFPCARIEMGWRLFMKACASDKQSLYEIARLNPSLGDIWVQHQCSPNSAYRGQEFDRTIVERWFEGLTKWEIQEQPKVGEEWLEGEYPLTYIRISLDVIRRHG